MNWLSRLILCILSFFSSSLFGLEDEGVHATIHTYPEHGACFVDLFTCGEKCSSVKFDEALRRYLKPKRVVQKMLVRRDDIHDF